MENDLKIIELRGENFKKIKVITIRPDDDLVLLTGKNAQGKSSVIDLIIAMLRGKNTKMIPQPIRQGQTHADGRMDLGKFIVTCKWTEKGQYLQVTSAEGAVYPSPQAMLDTFVGEISFDLSKFIEMEDKERTELFLRLAGLDFAPIDQEIDRLVEERRLQGIKMKMYAGDREVITIKDLPKEPINLSVLQNKYDEAMEHNRTIEQSFIDEKNHKIEIENNKYEIKQLLEKIEKMKLDIEDCKENIVEEKKQLEQIDGYLKENKIIITDDLRQEMVDSVAINNQIEANERNKVKDSKHKYELSIYEKLTAKITDRRNSKDKALQEAKLPLPGLTVNTFGTFFNGIPINQLSTSENMKVAMSIAMALNYKLKVILVKNASLLDDDNIKVIKEMVKGKGYQVWLEKVDSTGEMGFYFVDGEIESINGEKVIEEDIEDGELVDKSK